MEVKVEDIIKYQKALAVCNVNTNHIDLLKFQWTEDYYDKVHTEFWKIVDKRMQMWNTLYK